MYTNLKNKCLVYTYIIFDYTIIFKLDYRNYVFIHKSSSRYNKWKEIIGNNQYKKYSTEKM